jgi:hypothetical protein
MTLLKKLLIGVALILALGLGALTGAGLTAWSPGGAVPVAYADGCDGFPPPPEPDCPATPTPTPIK